MLAFFKAWFRFTLVITVCFLIIPLLNIQEARDRGYLSVILELLGLSTVIGLIVTAVAFVIQPNRSGR